METCNQRAREVALRHYFNAKTQNHAGDVRLESEATMAALSARWKEAADCLSKEEKTHERLLGQIRAMREMGQQVDAATNGGVSRANDNGAESRRTEAAVALANALTHTGPLPSGNFDLLRTTVLPCVEADAAWVDRNKRLDECVQRAAALPPRFDALLRCSADSLAERNSVWRACMDRTGYTSTLSPIGTGEMAILDAQTRAIKRAARDAGGEAYTRRMLATFPEVFD